MEMKRLQKIAFAIVLLPGLISAVNAGTQYIGQIIQQVSQSGTWTVGLSTGSNTIGKVDQGVGGTSAWKVDGSAVTQPISAISLPLPSGAATSAKQDTEISSLSSIDGKLNSLGQKAMAASVPVVIASDQSSIPVTPSIPTSANVTKSSVTATTTSAQLFAAEATRKGIECTALCTNTDYVFLNINSVSSATVTDYPLSPCSSWSPPDTLIITGAAQVISNSGSQVVRCVSYLP